eukprot:m.126000 g.126000  ORF g.126000 m.126000 type:complete len:118 (-) comp11180_c0_seq2:2232-2585(-)
MCREHIHVMSTDSFALHDRYVHTVTAIRSKEHNRIQSQPSTFDVATDVCINTLLPSWTSMAMSHIHVITHTAIPTTVGITTEPPRLGINLFADGIQHALSQVVVCIGPRHVHHAIVV